MSVYLIVQITIADREEYALYEAGFMEVFMKHGGTMLSVDESPTVIEGDWTASRSVLIRFPSDDAAMNWYNSPEYQNLAKHRFKASTGNCILVQGFDQPEEEGA